MSKRDEQLARMKGLMTYGMVTESKSAPVEESFAGADGKTYSIFREGTKFYIKSAPNGAKLVKESFDYIGGYMNKKNNEFTSYNQASKHLELKLRSLNEAYGVAKPVEVLNPEKKEELVLEMTDAMKASLSRYRQIMNNAAHIMNESAAISQSNTGNPEAPKTASFSAKLGEPYTETAEAKLDADLKTTANDPEKQGEPYGDEKKAEEYKDAQYVPDNSVANQKPSGGKVVRVNEECEVSIEECEEWGSCGLPSDAQAGTAEVGDDSPYTETVNEEMEEPTGFDAEGIFADDEMSLGEAEEEDFNLDDLDIDLDLDDENLEMDDDIEDIDAEEAEGEFEMEPEAEEEIEGEESEIESLRAEVEELRAMINDLMGEDEEDKVEFEEEPEIEGEEEIEAEPEMEEEPEIVPESHVQIANAIVESVIREKIEPDYLAKKAARAKQDMATAHRFAMDTMDDKQYHTLKDTRFGMAQVIANELPKRELSEKAKNSIAENFLEMQLLMVASDNLKKEGANADEAVWKAVVNSADRICQMFRKYFRNNEDPLVAAVMNAKMEIDNAYADMQGGYDEEIDDYESEEAPEMPETDVDNVGFEGERELSDDEASERAYANAKNLDLNSCNIKGKKINEEGTKLNVFGKHPGYRKKPMTLPATGSDKEGQNRDWNDESVYSEQPFGEKIGSSAPYEKDIEKIVNSIVESYKKKL